MSAIANITAYDGEATPVAHTLKPIFVRREDDGSQVALYRETVSGVPLEAQPTLRLTQKALPSGVHRFSARVEIPVMESVSGQNSAGYTAAPKVAYTVTGEAVVYSPVRATPQQRKNARHLLINLLAGLTTSSGPYSSGPTAELVDDGVSPT